MEKEELVFSGIGGGLETSINNRKTREVTVLTGFTPKNAVKKEEPIPRKKIKITKKPKESEKEIEAEEPVLKPTKLPDNIRVINNEEYPVYKSDKKSKTTKVSLEFSKSIDIGNNKYSNLVGALGFAVQENRIQIEDLEKGRYMLELKIFINP